ncbi:MAG TPA: hypothetical protein VFO77_03110, partial [Actinoplanes sp.]|nr:hypothetical protein [Actinoplanes sp.]
VAGYDVYVNDLRYGSTSATSLTVPPVGFGTFTFSVVAFDGAGNRSPALKQTLAVDPGPTSDARPPTAPTQVTAWPMSTGVNWNWKASTDNVGVAGYEVFRGNDWVGNVTGPAFAEPWRSGENAYRIRVRAYDVVGNKSAFVDGWVIFEPPFPNPVSSSPAPLG